MSNDKTTLADVQPGGRVRLGDQAERARFEDWYVQNAFDYTTNPIGSRDCALMWNAWYAALSAQPHPPSSFDLEAMLAACVPGGDIADPQVIADNIRHWFAAQPSPGGQGLDPGRVAVEFIAAANFDVPDGYVVEEHLPGIWHYTYTDAGEKMASCASWNNKAHATIAAWQAALAARQPVGEPAYNSAGISLTACQLHEALLMAGDPELDVPFEDRSLVRIFWTETGHSGPGLYCECVDAEEEGCILLDGTAPAIGQSAQAVDLGDFKALYRASVRLLESGRDRIIDLGGACDPVDVMEANDVDLQAARRVIDSQAVGK